MIKVFIADDESLIRDGLRAITEAETDIEVVGEAANGLQAVDEVARLAPDVALIDIRMPELDGLEATRRILALPDPPKVVVLTTFDVDEYVYAAITSGASGFLLKDSRRTEIVHAIRTVHTGDALVASAVTRRLVEQLCRPTSSTRDSALVAQLTTREREVLKLIGLGRSNTEIAAELFVGESTVKTHVSRVLNKLGARDRAQAVVLAYQSGLVTVGDV